MHMTCIVGARPNFMKVAPILHAAARHPDVRSTLVHTGQHYDERMSALFFDDLGLPKPDVYLGVGSGSHAAQTARVMMAFDDTLNGLETDLVVVVGDVNSTLACALVASKRHIPVAHVEAGLRSRDRAMPEEINRILTDQLADLLFTTEREAADNLRAEGIGDERIHFVGNVMIDTLYRHRAHAVSLRVASGMGLTERGYALATLHRPSNVDDLPSARNTVAAIDALVQRLPVVMPLHPRTRAKLEEFGLMHDLACRPTVRILEPLGYFEFLSLMNSARVVFTDSGGIQEETTALGVPCLTFRDSTERPITVTEGTNRLVGVNPRDVAAALDEVLRDGGSTRAVPELWDGRASERIVDVLRRWYMQRPLTAA